jgi:plasmid stabilization system protein ParE
MRIVYEEQFRCQLKAILAFIARDNPYAARAFRDGLKARIENIPENPHACRQSPYFDEDSIRDLIFMGYTAIYRITDNEIRLLDIFKWQER